MTDSGCDFSPPVEERALDRMDGCVCPAWVILRCLALSRTALQEHLDGHVQEMLVMSLMQEAAPLKAREGVALQWPHVASRLASILTRRWARPGWAEGVRKSLPLIYSHPLGQVSPWLCQTRWGAPGGSPVAVYHGETLQSGG